MTTFQKIKFGDLIEEKTSFPLKKGPAYSFIPMENVLSGKRTSIALEKKLFTGSGSRFKNGDTLFARITPCLQNKKITYANNLDGGIGFGSTEFFIFRAKADISDSLYIYYLSNLDQFRNAAELSMTGASGRQRADEFVIRRFEIMAPDLPAQTHIASILSSYDDLIENNEKRIKALEEMAQLLYAEWFVKPVKNGLPKGWEIKELGKLVENIHTSTKAGVHLANRQYIPIENISRKSFILKESSGWKEAQSSLVLFEKNDILFGAMRPYFHKVALASVPGVTRTTCLVLRAKEDIFRPLALLTIFSDTFISFASSNTKGATIPYSAWENSLENYKVLVPSEDILIKFNKKLDSVINQLVVLVSQNNNLSQTRDLLIPQLVTGKRELKSFYD
jgi:type I restriction enzyme S subunit